MPDRIAAAAGRPAMTAGADDALHPRLARRRVRQHGPAGRRARRRRVDVIHVVGGGSQNQLLCQLTADAAGVPVLAGPVEATALGNVLVQARAHGAAAGLARSDPRSMIAASFPLRRYEPTMNPYRHAALGRALRPHRDRPDRAAPRQAASVADLRRIARRRLPGGVFDYIDGGAEDERTLAANDRRVRPTTFRPRVLRDVAKVDDGSTILGRPLAYPLVLAPTGFTRIADPDGELAVARAAERAGLPYTLSTLSTRSIEEVRAVSDGRLWFQVYAWRDRGLVAEMIRRAAAARYEALVLTVDTAVLGGASGTSGAASRCRRPSASARSSTARSTRAGRGRSCAASRSASPTSSAGTSATAPRR